MKILNFYLILIVLLWGCSSKDQSKLNNELRQDAAQKRQTIKLDYSQKWTEFFNDTRQGNPYITNFDFAANANPQNFAIVQDNDLVMLFANRHGVQTFDGTEWKMVDTPNMPITLVKDDETGKSKSL